MRVLVSDVEPIRLAPAVQRSSRLEDCSSGSQRILREISAAHSLECAAPSAGAKQNRHSKRSGSPGLDCVCDSVYRCEHDLLLCGRAYTQKEPSDAVRGRVENVNGTEPVDHLEALASTSVHCLSLFNCMSRTESLCSMTQLGTVSTPNCVPSFCIRPAFLAARKACYFAGRRYGQWCCGTLWDVFRMQNVSSCGGRSSLTTHVGERTAGL
ncbi:unnamed protein product [Rangifer tarandus platyrhynchus]|uniref:Uncharacterized protein n=1 Tax=Rangifer tarandus platyrhynchus TaxID=3082113 RepID=A0ABN8XNW4_RANTA|nr:unnamed protein product [Rangifer tarandus platyrhynchus]